jgi:hypothetical protein
VTLRRVLMGLAALPLVVAVALAVAALALFLPPFLDDRKLDAIVVVVAADWRDFGKDRAETRLEYELDHEGVGLAVGPGDCGLVEDGDVRRVRCAWDTAVVLPLLDERVPLSFASEAHVDAGGVARAGG